MRRASILCVLSIVVLAGRAAAHERDFTLSRDWHLPYKGEMEIESRSFLNMHSHDFTQQFEFEYGVTDHFAIEPGIDFKKPSDDDFELEAFEVELRFNFLEFAVDSWLPALNVEYEHPREEEEDDAAGGQVEEEGEGDHLELKAIVSRYWTSGADFSVNLNYGFALEKDGEDESEITAGYTRPIDWLPDSWQADFAGFKAGVEAIQQLRHEHFLGIGPVLSWRATPHLHFLTTYVVAINERHDENRDELRLIIEWEF